MDEAQYQILRDVLAAITELMGGKIISRERAIDTLTACADDLYALAEGLRED